MKKYVCLSCVRKAMLCLAAVVLCCSAQMLFAGNNPTSETDQKPETETLAADNIQPGDYTIVGSCSSTGGSFEVSPRDYDATNYRWSVDNGWTPYVNDQYFCQFEGNEFHGSFYVTVSFTDGNGQQVTVYRQFTVN